MDCPPVNWNGHQLKTKFCSDFLTIPNSHSEKLLSRLIHGFRDPFHTGYHTSPMRDEIKISSMSLRQSLLPFVSLSAGNPGYWVEYASTSLHNHRWCCHNGSLPVYNPRFPVFLTGQCARLN